MTEIVLLIGMGLMLLTLWKMLSYVLGDDE